MDMKVYRKTRYQNIYQHIKNKNYVISMSKPVKTSISRIDNKKISSLDEAMKIRDNVLIKQQKALETIHKEDFDTLWDKYMFDCKYIKKLAYNSLLRKEKDYNKYLKQKIAKPIAKTNQEFWSQYLDELQCSNKQKNEILKKLKAFFNWCIQNDILINNPINKIQKYKVSKSEMLYWTPDELKSFLDAVNHDLNSNKIETKRIAYLVKILTLIGFNLGDRIGETRALTFDCISVENQTLKILHSINYDRSSDDFLSNTKTYHSQRVIDISSKLIEEIQKYREFLKHEIGYNVKDKSMIFFNYKTNKPYCDVTLRKHFHRYCEKAKVSKIRLYDLRHTYVATTMMEGKELYHISERIGHNNYSTTVNKYGHLSNEVRKEIAQTTDKYY